MGLIDLLGLEINLEADSIVFAVIGDYGKAGVPEEKVANLVKSWNPDFIITTGDNNYERGTLQTININISEYYKASTVSFRRQVIMMPTMTKDYCLT